MPRRVRGCAVLKWGGVGLSALLAAAWCISGWVFGSAAHVREYSTLVSLRRGQFAVLWFRGWAHHWPAPGSGWHFRAECSAFGWDFNGGWGSDHGIRAVNVPP